MLVGIPKEIKRKENRVAMVPAGVEQLAAHGHRVLVETGAGEASGYADQDYLQAGASIARSPEEVFQQSEMVVKVKEPLPPEYPLMRDGQTIFTFFHFASSEGLTRAAIEAGVVAVAYETVAKANGSLPILTPMSEIAGRMSIQEGAKYLEKTYGGRGVLLSGVPGVMPGIVTIIGAGTVGTNAAKIACSLGAIVYLLDNNLDRLRYLSDVMPKNCVLLMSNPANIRETVYQADLVVGAILIPGAKAPFLVTRDMLKNMKKGSVIVDVAVDQGGSFETSRPTTHDDPIYVVDGVIHYCVANMPGAVSVTSTAALTNATLPYVIKLADLGYRRAARENPELAAGINIVNGKVTCRGVAEAFGLEYVPLAEVLS
ncbi:MAG: alanine dehydrogenase [Smithellaceae bacterium]|nr:alanine dehydrogenase [Smithellaceae bacterium]